MELTYDKGLPFSKKGFGVLKNWYMSGRVSASVGFHGGMTSVKYYGRQALHKVMFFKATEVSSFSKLFRMQLVINGKNYYPEFNDTTHYPMGFVSFFHVGNIKIKWGFSVLEHAIVQFAEVLENPDNISVAMRVCTHRAEVSAPDRVWSTWNTDERTVSVTVKDKGEKVTKKENDLSQIVSHEVPDSETYIGVGYQGEPDQFRITRNKYYLNDAPGKKHAFYLAFASSEADYKARMAELSTTAFEQAVKRFADYEDVLKKTARISNGVPSVEAAFVNAVPHVMALELADKPGAFRASQDYWVWGWDSMVHADSFLYAGFPEAVRNMLRFYKETADPVNGISHCFETDYSTAITMAFSAQCIYVNMLYSYRAATDDAATVREVYPFAKWIIEESGKKADPETGLSSGIAYFPDFPDAVGGTGHDLSVINNVLYYQALRAMTALAEDTGDSAYAKDLTGRADRLLKSFRTVLYDPEKKYWMDSVSSDDLSPRKHYPLYALFRVTPFFLDPANGIEKETAEFMRKNFLFKNGLFMFPAWDDAFMSDGNQMGAYSPPVDRGYWSMMNLVGNKESVDDMNRIIDYFSDWQTYPEGLTQETENDEPTPDNPGGKQCFSAKSWFCDLIELNLGLNVYLDGFTLNPLNTGKPFEISNLNLYGKRFRIVRSGTGSALQVKVNGKAVAKPEFKRTDFTSAKNLIELTFC